MQKTDFNRDWTVQKDGSTEILHVNLPDDAMIREERSKENKTASASAYFAGGKYIYTKIFNLSEDETRQTLILEFEAVYQNAIVFLNGRQVAERPYGYTNFFVDITGKVIAGTNELKVVADNADVPNSRWYSGSGIYREVHLYRSGSSYIRPEGLKVQIVDLNTIHIFADAVMQPNEKIVLEIFSDSGKIASAEGTDVTITIPDAHLWSSEDPYLYTCQATLLQGKTAIDTAKSSFGIRTLSWGKDGFLVNNNPVLFRGACIHHDNGVLGACGFHDAEFRRVRILKEAGFNAIRSSHNPISKAMLDACDKLGMYVIDEAFDMWLINKVFQKIGEKDRKLYAQYPACFCNVSEPYDKKNHAARYHFTQCPNAEFAKKHNLMHILALFCNSDYWGISQLNGTLIRCGTCGNSDKCDYCVVGSENPMAKEYEIVKDKDGFLVSRKIVV